MTDKKRMRVIVAKVGLDTHDQGAKIVSNALRDAGMEVIYLRPHTTPEQVVKAALQEDVDIIGLSILSGAHMTLCSKIITLLKTNGISDKPVLVGGVIPKKDILELKKMGVKEIFPMGTHPDKIVEFIQHQLPNRDLV